MDNQYSHTFPKLIFPALLWENIKKPLDTDNLTNLLRKKSSKFSENMYTNDHKVKTGCTRITSFLPDYCATKITLDIKLGQLPGALLFAWSENYTNLSAFKWDTIQTHFFMCLISYKKVTVLTLHALFILSPYKVLGKREQSKFLCPCHFLALNLHIYYKDLETWYSKSSSMP